MSPPALTSLGYQLWSRRSGILADADALYDHWCSAVGARRARPVPVETICASVLGTRSDRAAAPMRLAFVWSIGAEPVIPIIRTIERWRAMFAARLLAPADLLGADVQRIGLDVHRLAALYDTSETTIAYRLHVLGMMP